MLKYSTLLGIFKIIYIYLHYNFKVLYWTLYNIINKRKLFMSNVVTKLDSEVRWGAMLGVMQGDLDKTCSVLNLVINQVSDAMHRRVKELADKGITEPAGDGIYNRCFQLYNMLGGIYAVMRGADGIMSGVIVEMLRDLDEK